VTDVTKGLWGDDDALLADLADAVRQVEPLARTVADHGYGVYSWRTVEAELLIASLSFDSSLEQVSEVRTEEECRVLVFSARPLSVELEVMSDQIVGQLIPPGVGEIRVETPAGEALRIDADERGFFVVSPLPTGRVRLRCDTPTGRVVTDWVTL
jgi:hypothetical protein